MRCPNALAKLIVMMSRSRRTLSAANRVRLQALAPACTGVVFCMVWHALRYYSVEC